MCGRSSLTKVEKEIEARFHATFYTEELERYNPLPNYNVAPTQLHPIINSDDKMHLQFYKWGLIPFWAKDGKIGAKMINARAETLNEKAAFKNLLTSRRCIVPLDGFYEWKKEGKEKIPYRIITTDQEIFSIAGLWDIWKDQNTNNIIHSFTIITVAANELMLPIHDRMPAILLPSHENIWLDETVKPSDATQLLIPYPSVHMEAFQVSNQVNNVRTNDPTLIDRVVPIIKPVQTSLF